MNRWLPVAMLSVLLICGCSSGGTPTAPAADDPPAATPIVSQPAAQTRYYVDSKTIIGQDEASDMPPIDRWPVLKELSNTASVDLLCHPNSSQIRDSETVAEIVKLLQASSYMAVSEYPRDDPDIKIYFRRPDDSFIMAARLFLEEGILESPEGPWIKTSPKLADLLGADTVCTP